MCDAKLKKRLMAVLVLCFVVQTSLVYSDERSEPLSEAALAGRQIYHREGCQVCHQFYGQGGFLGPDLTNAASRVDSTRLASLLTVGSGQMPAFGMSDEEIAQVSAFLTAMDRPDVGRGQLRLGDRAAGGLQTSFERAVTERLADGPAEAEAGFALVRARVCTACHFPFQTSPVGAPDMSTAVERLPADSIDAVLARGRPLNGMPAPVPALTDGERSAVIAYLEFLNEHRPALRTRTGDLTDRRIDWSRMQWWGFR